MMNRNSWNLSQMAGGAVLIAALLSLSGCIAEDTLYADDYHVPSQSSEVYSLQKVKSKTLKCGNWPDDLAYTAQNTAYYNNGCAVQSNIAAMIANPSTINRPHKTDLPAGAPATAAVRNMNSTNGGGGANPLAALLGGTSAP